MSLVLVPGEVHPYSSNNQVIYELHPKATGFSPTLKIRDSPLQLDISGQLRLSTFNSVQTMRMFYPDIKVGGPSEYGMLASCRQILHEGEDMYFRLNTFFLPAGPLEHSLSYVRSLAPHHRSSIRSVAIQISVSELMPKHIQKTENAVYYGEYDSASFFVELSLHDKLDWLRSRSDLYNLEHVKLFREENLIWEGGPESIDYVPSGIWDQVRLHLDPYSDSGHRTREYGWSLTKMWIRSGACHDDWGRPVIWTGSKWLRLTHEKDRRLAARILWPFLALILIGVVKSEHA
ncbi:MAG: hypothetical protein Q9190_007509, partial [Brigantiaea leucoxantha]